MKIAITAGKLNPHLCPEWPGNKAVAPKIILDFSIIMSTPPVRTWAGPGALPHL